MIYTIAKVKVDNYVSVIERPIVLYRGDKNVEIQFELYENTFKQYFRESTDGANIILNMDASFGQLVIQRPDGTAIFSEVAETLEGRVVLTVTAEMIDELTELGLYTFQIRLFNDDQTSRVTLPPVYEGIDIQEPIAIEE